MADDSVRDALEAMIRRSGEGYAALSRMIGRNPAYIQQFIKRGVPRRLSETDRQLLAGHFGVSEALLGAPAPPGASLSPRVGRHGLETGAPPLAATPGQDVRALPYLAPRLADAPHLLIDQRLLAQLSGGRHKALAAHVVDGDSMAPTLVAGDRLIVDLDARIAPQDGVHVIEGDGALLVRRLSIHPVSRRIAILSDNGAYPSFADCDPTAVGLVGRVVWMSRILG